MEDKKIYKKVLDNLFEGVYFVDNDRRMKFWNKTAEEITGFSSEDVIGKFCFNNILNHIDENGMKLCKNGCPLHATLKDGVIRENRVYLLHKNGQRIAVAVKTIPIHENNEIIGALEIFTDDREKTNCIMNLKELKELAIHDQLTKLPNRRYIESYISNRVDDYNKFEIPFGIIFIDIDHFKNVNDTYGHDIGDGVLKMVSETFKSGIRKNDMIGRWGGEEFIGVFTGIKKEELIKGAEKIRMLVENSKISNGSNNISVTVSIGATTFNDNESIDQIIKRADKNMYTAKNTGRNKVVCD